MCVCECVCVCEFVCVCVHRSKCYTFKTQNNVVKKSNCVNKVDVKEKFSFDDY